MEDWILLAHLASTLAMTGIIWFVQIVHYPLFSRVGVDAFQRYELDNTRVTTYVVLPLMLVELGSAILLFWCPPSGASIVVLGVNALLVAAIWLVTFMVQVPQHARLSIAFDAVTHRRLVAGNWVRTVLWTARAILVLWMLERQF